MNTIFDDIGQMQKSNAMRGIIDIKEKVSPTPTMEKCNKQYIQIVV